MIDAVTDREAALANLEKAGTEHGVGSCAISAVTGEGINRLLYRMFDLVLEPTDEVKESP